MTSLSRRTAWATLAASAALSALVSATPLAALTPGDLAFRQAVAEQSAEIDAVAAFYRERDFAPLWTTAADAGRRQALFAALDGAADHGLPAGRYDAAALGEKFRTVRSERERGQLEVAATRAFLAYAQDVRTGFIKPASIDAGLVREVPVRDPLATLRSFAAAGDPGAFVRALPPQGPDYAALRRGMLDLRRVIAAGGWGPAVGKGALEPGESGPAVIALRARMSRMGYPRGRWRRAMTARCRRRCSGSRSTTA